MNISKPVPSCIKSVEFAFLSSEEIKALSAKRIQNPITFDSLLHPVPGGLYDSTLGARGDTQCATCHLNAYNCPGHPGHIDLPVPVFHPVVFDQTLRLLRAKCSYCHHLRMPRAEVHRFTCKLRLIQSGLLVQAEELDQVSVKANSSANGVSSQDENLNGNSSDVSDEDVDDENLMARRAAFVSSVIKAASGKGHRPQRSTEAVAQKRKSVLSEFLALVTKGKKCSNCGGICPTYRRDGVVRVFEKGLSAKEHAKMIQDGRKVTNAMVVLHRKKQQSQKRKTDAMEIDHDPEDENEGEEDDLSVTDDDHGLLADRAPASAPTKSSKLASGSGPQRFVNAGEVHAALTLLFEKERPIMSLIYGSHRTKLEKPVSADMFFLSTLLVTPNKYRPESRVGNDEITEAPRNKLYKSILTQCDTINQIHREIRMHKTGVNGAEPGERKRDLYDLHDAWIRLQEAVNSLIDRDKNPIQGGPSRMNEEGIKQKLEKKEGLFRKNMMGKRVNFAARSVISPDPNLETNEVGIPPVFAKKLTYPEPVTNHNFYELKEAVLNGIDKWPGAAAVENENGQVISLRTKNYEERLALANQLLAPSGVNVNGSRNKKVHRHLNNGDVVLMNRQPTLHKPSIMGHRARVLPGEKTIRMHYANCNTYNADFDGDEMNLHFPQNEIARAEALQIADTDHQYLVATSGKPLRGLIQDHISMGVWMTNKDTLFDKGHYQQLLYSCLRPENHHTTSDRIMTVTPAIIKPQPLWTGKQVITTILKNIKPTTHPGLTLTSKSSTPGDSWGEYSEEGKVIFKDGELLCGILDKAQLGPSAGGLIHSVYEVYGHSIAGRLMGILGRVLTKFLHMRGFSCGMEDLVLTKRGERARWEKLKEADGIGLAVAAKYVKLEDKTPSDNDPELLSRLEDVLRSDDKQAGLDTVMNGRTKDLSSEVTRDCLPAGLAKSFPQNQMQAMTTSGAKGSSVNANLISCNLGQQVLEGRRVPTMVSGKTLPCFKPFDTNIRAGGYITDRFLTGIRPQEYFFHCMAGREGLIDTAVKTSRSGYLQRCLIKGMEGLRVEYDNSVRDADGSMVQFLYGEDGLDVTKQKHLLDFKFVAENFISHFEQLNVRDEFQHLLTDDAMDWNKAAMKKVKKTGRIDAMDPVLAHFSPSRYLFSTSETFTQALKKYEVENPEKLLRNKNKGIQGLVSKKNFETVLNLKYLKATVEPGEAVGIIAGQSIGEPSTQMTLNTFHLAGHSAMNVTLGIPRLREILMTASKKISTPVMTLHLNPELTQQEGEAFAKAISRLSLADLIDSVTVKERIGRGVAYKSAKLYDIKIKFYPAKEYSREYSVDISDVALTLEEKFAPRLQKAIRAEFRKKGGKKIVEGAPTNAASTGERQDDALPEIGQSAGAIEEASARPEADADGEGGDEDNDDDDGANTKGNRAAQDASYSTRDEDDERIAAQGRREASPDMDMEDGAPDPEAADREDDDDKDDADSPRRPPSAKQRGQARQDRIKAENSDFVSFAMDEATGEQCAMQLEYASDTPKILILPLIESLCRSTVMHAIPGIYSSTLTSEKTHDAAAAAAAASNAETTTTTTTAVVLTEGVNLAAMHDYQDHLNPHRLFTNDIAAMLAHYGIEACRATIMREMDAVFASHAIAVDKRHLTLIADMMTRAGTFQPFSRIGIKSCPSPFLKMSFETTMAFLKDAALYGEVDELLSPSARLVVGNVGRVGTGAFDVLMPVT